MNTFTATTEIASGCVSDGEHVVLAKQSNRAYIYHKKNGHRRNMPRSNTREDVKEHLDGTIYTAKNTGEALTLANTRCCRGYVLYGVKCE